MALAAELELDSLENFRIGARERGGEETGLTHHFPQRQGELGRREGSGLRPERLSRRKRAGKSLSRSRPQPMVAGAGAYLTKARSGCAAKSRPESSSFETRPAGAPQDEDGGIKRSPDRLMHQSKSPASACRVASFSTAI